MRRETKCDRRARVGLESLEGRELMAAGPGPWMRLAALEHQVLIAAAELPGQFRATLMEVRLFNQSLLRASRSAHRPVHRAINFGSAAVDKANGSVTLTGFTYPGAKVRLDRLPGRTIERTDWADASGRFQITIPIDLAGTPVRVVATARGHRAASTIVTPKQLPSTLVGLPSPETPSVGVPVPATPPPTTTPTPVGVPPGSTQVPATGSAGDAYGSEQASYAAINDLYNFKFAIDNSLLPDGSGGGFSLFGF
jgi:hypothetical protein